MTDEQARIIAEYNAVLDAGEGVIELGRTVLCDRCNTDLTDDPRSGGIIFGTYGYGPCCVEAALVTIRRYHEEEYIRATCPPGQSYADWIREIRGPHTQIVVERGTGPGVIFT